MSISVKDKQEELQNALNRTWLKSGARIKCDQVQSDLFTFALNLKAIPLEQSHQCLRGATLNIFETWRGTKRDLIEPVEYRYMLHLPSLSWSCVLEENSGVKSDKYRNEVWKIRYESHSDNPDNHCSLHHLHITENAPSYTLGEKLDFTAFLDWIEHYYLKEICC